MVVTACFFPDLSFDLAAILGALAVSGGAGVVSGLFFPRGKPRGWIRLKR